MKKGISDMENTPLTFEERKAIALKKGYKEDQCFSHHSLDNLGIPNFKKLTLKHLVPYLPYGLNVVFDNKLIGILSGIRPNLLTELIVMEELDNNTPIYKNWCLDNTKLVLRPLSDLTKEIEINGEKFVPLTELLKISNFNVSKMSWEEQLEYIDSYSDLSFVNFYDLQLLFKWHFDVFGLIEQGLAIDINTLKSE